MTIKIGISFPALEVLQAVDDRIAAVITDHNDHLVARKHRAVEV